MIKSFTQCNVYKTAVKITISWFLQMGDFPYQAVHIMMNFIIIITYCIHFLRTYIHT